MMFLRCATALLLLLLALAGCHEAPHVLDKTAQHHFARPLSSTMPDSPPGCRGEQFAFVTTLAQLPAEVRIALARGGPLSDHGGAFNDSDVQDGDPPSPMRRFGSAIVGDSHLFAAVEHGGVGYGIEMLDFERHGDAWHETLRGSVSGVPDSLREFLSLTCEQVGAIPPPRALPADMRVHCEFAAGGVSLLKLEDATHVSAWRMDSPDAAPGTPPRRVISDASSREPLSAADASELAARLQAVQGWMGKDGYCRPAVEDFLKALAAAPPAP